MLAKEIEYTDYNGNVRKETCRFDLSIAELTKLELTTPGGLKQYMERIVAAQDVPELYKAFEQFIRLSYGEKTDDGRRFVKSEEISEAFCQTPAYSILLMELITDANKAADFINAIMPPLSSIPVPENVAQNKITSITEAKDK